ncbi:hypothetical protein [Pseudomonas protegens]|uniref:hypothetical protein n=1 Tax=Pseudomonas protegens TaxID=380021 RepID=UPI001F22662F|nr:hypothetical protein [Pseudomonas protegens]
MSNEMISVSREELRVLLNGPNPLASHQALQARDRLRLLLAKPAEQHQGEPIRLTAVAELIDNGDGGLEPSWLLEGGTAELFPGMVLLVADNAPKLCEEDGSAELYTRPAEQPAPVAVVPEGWQLVPTVPTDDMIVAFAEAWYSKRQAIDDPDMLDAYRDMLVVAPSPPQQ